MTDSLTKSMGKLTVGLGATSLAVRSAKMVKDSLKNPKPKKLVKGMVDLTVGTALLSSMASIVNDLD